MDCSKILPGFRYAPGLLNWKVFDKNFHEHHSLEEVPDELKSVYSEGHFADEKFNQQNNLNFCMRLLPHHSNDAGFFVAILKKVGKLPWEDLENNSPENNSQILERIGPYLSPRVKQSLKQQKFLTTPFKPQWGCRKLKKEMFEFCNKEDENLSETMDFYGLSLDPNQMFKIGKKNYHLANNAIRGLIEESDDAKHNIFHAGVNVFVPCIQTESRVKLRISHTGRPLLTPQISSKLLYSLFFTNVYFTYDYMYFLNMTKQSASRGIIHMSLHIVRIFRIRYMKRPHLPTII